MKNATDFLEERFPYEPGAKIAWFDVADIMVDYASHIINQVTTNDNETI